MRFLITETNEYLIDAPSEEQALEMFLADESDAEYIGTTSRMVQEADQ
jgi:hypothetical protein